MARFRTLDKNGDMTFGKGLNNYSTGQDAVKLDVRTRLYSWIGDCFFDVDAGVDWWNRLGSKGQENILSQELRSVILNSEDVRSIVDFSFNVEGRKFTAQYKILTTFSQTFVDQIERTL